MQLKIWLGLKMYIFKKHLSIWYMYTGNIILCITGNCSRKCNICAIFIYNKIIRAKHFRLLSHMYICIMYVIVYMYIGSTTTTVYVYVLHYEYNVYMYYLYCI